MKVALIMPGNKLEEAVKISCMLVDAMDRFGWKYGAEAFGMHFQTGRIIVMVLVPDDETKLEDPDCIKEIAVMQYRLRWYEDPNQRGCIVLRYHGKNILYHAKEFAKARGMNWFEYKQDEDAEKVGERMYIREQLNEVIHELSS